MGEILGPYDPRMSTGNDSLRSIFADSAEKNCVVFKKANIKKSEMETVFWFGGRVHPLT
jgi:hypothetical protein